MTSVLVCGSGNAAQVCACIFGARYKVIALSLDEDETTKWQKSLKEAGRMECTLQTKKVVKSTPDRITSDPSAAKECDVILFTVPSLSHEQYLKALAPHVQDNTIFAVMPARSGVDILFKHVMGDKTSKLGLAAFETLPWACKVNEWGKTTIVLGTKEQVSAAVQPPAKKTVVEVMCKLQGLFGVEPRIVQCPNMMDISLGNPGQVVHPGIFYSKWKTWDGNPVQDKPLFYHGADEFCAQTLNGLSDEIQAVCKKLKSYDPKFDTSNVKPFFQWYLESYRHSCKDTSNLQRAMVTNQAYAGLCHPMRGDGYKGYIPDFKFRYLSEDVPTGLCFTKGVADLLGVPTPTIDAVIGWCQSKLGKEYMSSDGRMSGRDVGETRAPQAFGIKTRQELLNFWGLKGGGPCASVSQLLSAVSQMCSSK